VEFTNILHMLQTAKCSKQKYWHVESLQISTFTQSLTGPLGQPFACRYEELGFNPQGGTYVKLGWDSLVNVVSLQA
jgi:hypothetical protein